MNVAAYLSRAAHLHGDRAALRCEDRTTSYGDLDLASGRLARAMLEQGLTGGDRVAIFMRNSDAYLSALYGIWKAGLVAVPVNAKLHPRELQFILDDSGARALIYDEHSARDIEALDRVPELAVGAGPGAGGDLEELTMSAGDPLATVEVERDQIAWLFYTSGTTGRPKGAAISHRNLQAMAMTTLAEVCDFQATDRILHLAPLSHGSGLYALVAMIRGSEQVIHAGRSFDPVSALATIERERITVLPFLAPTMVLMLLEEAGRMDLSSVRALIYGGAPMHRDHVRRALERFGPVLTQIYGQGEAPMSISVLPSWLHDPDDDELLGSVGIPRANVEVMVVDADDSPLPPGEPGEIRVRGDVVIAGYWRNPEASASAVRDGWLHTGDVGRFDARGVLTLVERTNDVIISGGANIYPREVEEALLAHPAVAGACVYGVPNEKWGEAVAATVVPRTNRSVSADELIACCKERIASFKKPTTIQFADRLPTNAYGKVLRRELVARHAGSQSDRR